MDILTHTLTGVSVGMVVAGFSGKSFRKKTGIVALGGIGGALPDLDAISLWSGFDKTFGKVFGLTAPGKDIYSSKLWYSHHGFMHSILAGLLVALIIGLMIYLLRSKLFSEMNLFKCLKMCRHCLISFVAGYVFHLLEDMPTPACVWGGVNFFWPFKSYVGGTGDIWWWNNYDIFLIVAGVTVINGFLLLLGHLISYNSGKILSMVFVVGCTLVMCQIKTRGFDFDYSGHTARYQEFEGQSMEIQKRILGERVYGWMNALDKGLKVNF
ncbi:metal-dependent hydrolase [Marinilabiliaceae bacterium JC017]|nr:metal-dependent hydrolase [Marinilabiliaceae bacterium JC017]